MKSSARCVAAWSLAAVLTFLLPITAAAAPRDTRERELPNPVVRIIKKLFGISAQDDLPLPPRPEPKP